MHVDHDTLSLARLISNDNKSFGEIGVDRAARLFKKAEHNKIPLLFLEALGETYQARFSTQAKKYYDAKNAAGYMMAEVADKLNKAEVEYVIFKTLKPFPYAPADIDLLLASREDLKKTCNLLSSSENIHVAKDSYTHTFRSTTHGLNIDLYEWPTVANMIYLDKTMLFNHTTECPFNGFSIKTLDSVAEIVAVASHAIYKEQTYTLAEHFTIIHHLRTCRLENVIEVSSQTSTLPALMISLSASNALIQATQSNEAINIPYGNEKESFPLEKLDFPFKLKPSLIAWLYLKKIQNDRLARSTTPLLVRRLFTIALRYWMR